MLPGTGKYSLELYGNVYIVNGTCVCNCSGCYAESGFYRMKNVSDSLAINTILANEFPEFVENAIRAQLEIWGAGKSEFTPRGILTQKIRINTRICGKELRRISLLSGSGHTQKSKSTNPFLTELKTLISSNQLFRISESISAIVTI